MTPWTWAADIREFFVLGRARDCARRRAEGDRVSIEALRRAGRARRRAARELGSLDPFAPSAILYLDAIRAFARAHAIARGKALDPSTDPIADLAIVVRARAADDSWSRVQPLFSPSDPLAIDRLTVSEAGELRVALDRVASIADAALDCRSLEHLAGLRVGRTAAAILGIAFVLVRAMIWLIAVPNVAYHKPVTASSSFALFADAEGLVDGITGGLLPGFHTQPRENNPWVLVDLKQTYRISSIRIYNRGDTAFDDCLPLAVQLSEDGVTFQELARRTTHFDQSPPWILDAKGRRARYVRLQSMGIGYIALSEVEVYGRR